MRQGFRGGLVSCLSGSTLLRTLTGEAMTCGCLISSDGLSVRGGNRGTDVRPDFTRVNPQPLCFRADGPGCRFICISAPDPRGEGGRIAVRLAPATGAATFRTLGAAETFRVNGGCPDNPGEVAN